jgi:hypothetical protein
MLLNQFQEVSRIDAQISKIHKELTELYTRRHSITDASAPSFTVEPMSKADQLRDRYTMLAACWERYGCKVPSFRYLKPSLVRAEQILAEMRAANPLLTALCVLLVPPSSELPLPVPQAMRKQQTTLSPDYMSDELLPRAQTDSKWRVLVADAGSCGQKCTSIEEMLLARTYNIADYDARALGVREYAALSLQLGTMPQLDTNDSWTVLLKDIDALPNVACATCMGGRFRFDIDESHGTLGKNYFRPAVEVKVTHEK